MAQKRAAGRLGETITGLCIPPVSIALVGLASLANPDSAEAADRIASAHSMPFWHVAAAWGLLALVICGGWCAVGWRTRNRIGVEPIADPDADAPIHAEDFARRP